MKNKTAMVGLNNGCSFWWSKLHLHNLLDTFVLFKFTNHYNEMHS